MLTILLLATLMVGLGVVGLKVVWKDYSAELPNAVGQADDGWPIGLDWIRA